MAREPRDVCVGPFQVPLEAVQPEAWWLLFDGVNLDSIMAQQRFHMSRGKLTYKEPMEVDKFIDLSYLRRALAFLGPPQP